MYKNDDDLNGFTISQEQDLQRQGKRLNFLVNFFSTINCVNFQPVMPVQTHHHLHYRRIVSPGNPRNHCH